MARIQQMRTLAFKLGNFVENRQKSLKISILLFGNGILELSPTATINGIDTVNKLVSGQPDIRLRKNSNFLTED